MVTWAANNDSFVKSQLQGSVTHFSALYVQYKPWEPEEVNIKSQFRRIYTSDSVLIKKNKSKLENVFVKYYALNHKLAPKENAYHLYQAYAH